jgi:membrane-associated phospholipid phosphatase
MARPAAAYPASLMAEPKAGRLTRLSLLLIEQNLVTPIRNCIEEYKILGGLYAIMKGLRLLFLLLIAGALARTAHASDDWFNPTLPTPQKFLSHAAIRSLQFTPSYPKALAAARTDQSQSSRAADCLTSGAETGADNNQTDASGKQPTPALDRRDRVFYPDDTERVNPLARKLFLNILYDQKDIFTSPFHANRRNALEWLVPMAVTGAFIAGDTHIADAFENSRGQVRWGGRISNIGASYTLIPIIAGSYVYGAWRDNPKGREIGVLGTESVLDSLIVVGVLKEVFRRNRPDEKNPGDFWGGGTSFPSGHAIQIWSIASLLDHEYKHKKIVGITAYSLAGIVSASRIAAQKHFASDVVAGGTMGWFIGRYVYDTHMSHLAHTHSSLIPMIVPQVNPLHRSYSFSLLFHPGSANPL